MPAARIVLESLVVPSFRVATVRGMFDLPAEPSVRHEWDVSIPVEDRPWTIGLVVGPSGSGKTTIGKRLFGDALFHAGYDWPGERAVVDGFPECLDGKTVVQALSSVGFSSPPHWLKRFSHLSNGQKFRCELARLILEDAGTVVFDEFTSIVDRRAAAVGSAAVAKAVRARGKPRLVALSCHYDVTDWLDPDWVYDTADGSFSWRCLRGRPPLELRVYEAHVAAWPLFRGHHYLSRDINRSARCFVAVWGETPVAFTSFLTFPHPVVKNVRREHRTVVLPDFQGVGVGNRLSEWLGAYVTSLGYRFRSVTSHPAMVWHRCRSPLWRCDGMDMLSQHTATTRKMAGSNGWRSAMKRSSSAGRVTGQFEYVGPSLKDGLVGCLHG